MRRFLSTAVVKPTTGLTGLEVVPNARQVLIELYEKTLRDVQVRAWAMLVLFPAARAPRATAATTRQIIPEHAFYRKAVESFTQHRLKVVRETEDVRAGGA